MAHDHRGHGRYRQPWIGNNIEHPDAAVVPPKKTPWLTALSPLVMLIQLNSKTRR
ncbi:MAG: hypothetical protein P8130_16100 [Deltaproteobacteria bacterium]|jgi:hypothetical protein